MNITLVGTKITQDTKYLAFQKNNLVDNLSVIVDTDESWEYKLDVKYSAKATSGKELYNVIQLTRNGDICSVELTTDMLPFNGKYTMQLRGISGDKVYHSETFDCWVKYSIDPSQAYEPLPSEFYQFERQIEKAVPKGGTAGQVLTKAGDEDFDTEWKDIKAGVESVNGKTGDVELTADDVGALPNTTEIPHPNWSEMGPRSSDYVKNRTHYYTSNMRTPITSIKEDAAWEDGGNVFRIEIKNITLHYNYAYYIAIGDKSYTGVCTYASEMTSGYEFFGFNIANGLYTPNVTFNNESELSGYLDVPYSGSPIIPWGAKCTGTFTVCLNKNYYSTPPKVDIREYRNYTFHPLDSRYLPDSAILLDSDTPALKSPTDTDVTNSVREALGVDKRFVINLTQDSDGNLTADKTYAEIEAAIQSDSYKTWDDVVLYNPELDAYLPLTYIEDGATFEFGATLFDPGVYNIMESEQYFVVVCTKENEWSAYSGSSYVLSGASPNASTPEENLIPMYNHENNEWEIISVNNFSAVIVLANVTTVKDSTGKISHVADKTFDEINSALGYWTETPNITFGVKYQGILVPYVADFAGSLVFNVVVSTFEYEPDGIVSTNENYFLRVDSDNTWTEKTYISYTMRQNVANGSLTDDYIMMFNHDTNTWNAKSTNNLVLPAVSSSDNGKILKVVNGQWALVDPNEAASE